MEFERRLALWITTNYRNYSNPSCHRELIEAVLKLDYKQQFKLCYAFYDEIIRYPQFDENEHCLKFDDIYESINPDWLEEGKDKIQQCVEVMLEALREI